MTILKLFLDAYHDSDCQAIKIKLDFLLNNKGKETLNLPENLVKHNSIFAMLGEELVKESTLHEMEAKTLSAHSI